MRRQIIAAGIAALPLSACETELSESQCDSVQLYNPATRPEIRSHAEQIADDFKRLTVTITNNIEGATLDPNGTVRLPATQFNPAIEITVHPELQVMEATEEYPDLDQGPKENLYYINYEGHYCSVSSSAYPQRPTSTDFCKPQAQPNPCLNAGNRVRAAYNTLVNDINAYDSSDNLP